MFQKPSNEWFDSLAVGSRVAVLDFDNTWYMGVVVKLGAGKGQRFKVGRVGSAEQDSQARWFNLHGHLGGGYSFSDIYELTPERHEEIINGNLRRTLQDRVGALHRVKWNDVPTEKLRMINALIVDALKVMKA